MALKVNSMLRPALTACLLVALCISSVAQDRLPLPQLSPGASLSQTVGATEISVSYAAPAVRDRVIWGNKVPYDVVWRAGANTNTTVTLEHDVKVEGQALAAGTYGLHMIPGVDSFTIIFSQDSTSWGSYRYVEENDALRVTVTPQSAPKRERMAFLFDDVGDESATLQLHWDEVLVPVRIDVDVPTVVLAPVRENFAANSDKPGWEYWFQAADYGRVHGAPASETLAWVEKSVAIQKSFSNLWCQSELLADLNRLEEAESARTAALERVTADELADLGSRYLQREDPGAAAQVLTMVTEMGGAGWYVWSRLAQAREQMGDLPGAVEALKGALTAGPDPVTEGELKANLERVNSGVSG